MPIGPGFTGDSGGNGIINLGGLPGIQQGLFADLPAAGLANGVWYLATDTKVLYRWDLGSTAWVEELNDGGGGGGITNLGGLPGIQQGLMAARPAAGVADGVWYLATDTKVLYRWDLGTAAWVEELSDGTTQDWQSVMTAGNTSTRTAILNNAASANIAQIGQGLFNPDSGAWVISNANGFPLTGTSRIIAAFVDPTAAFAQDRLAILYRDKVSDNEYTFLLHRANTARRRVYLPDKTGDMMLGNTGTFTQVATALSTTITIPHGMWPLPDISITPSNSIVNALDAATRTVLLGGYYMSYNATNIIINLAVPIVGTPTLNIAWTAIV